MGRVRMNPPVSCFFLLIFYPGTEGSHVLSRLKTRNDITSSEEATPISEASTSTSAISNACPCGIKGSNDEGDGRIVGGDDADVQEYPWQVGIEINGQFPWCGGSLISETEILTAAHCTSGRRASPLTFSSSISPVCLPADADATFTGEVATVTGWGS